MIDGSGDSKASALELERSDFEAALLVLRATTGFLERRGQHFLDSVAGLQDRAETVGKIQ